MSDSSPSSSFSSSITSSSSSSLSSSSPQTPLPFQFPPFLHPHRYGFSLPMIFSFLSLPDIPSLFSCSRHSLWIQSLHDSQSYQSCRLPIQNIDGLTPRYISPFLLSHMREWIFNSSKYHLFGDGDKYSRDIVSAYYNKLLEQKNHNKASVDDEDEDNNEEDGSNKGTLSANTTDKKTRNPSNSAFYNHNFNFALPNIPLISKSFHHHLPSLHHHIAIQSQEIPSFSVPKELMHFPARSFLYHNADSDSDSEGYGDHHFCHFVKQQLYELLKVNQYLLTNTSSSSSSALLVSSSLHFRSFHVILRSSDILRDETMKLMIHLFTEFHTGRIEQQEKNKQKQKQSVNDNTKDSKASSSSLSSSLSQTHPDSPSLSYPFDLIFSIEYNSSWPTTPFLSLLPLWIQTCSALGITLTFRLKCRVPNLMMKGQPVYDSDSDDDDDVPTVVKADNFALAAPFVTSLDSILFHSHSLPIHPIILSLHHLHRRSSLQRHLQISPNDPIDRNWTALGTIIHRMKLTLQRVSVDMEPRKHGQNSNVFHYLEAVMEPLVDKTYPNIKEFSVYPDYDICNEDQWDATCPPSYGKLIDSFCVKFPSIYSIVMRPSILFKESEHIGGKDNSMIYLFPGPSSTPSNGLLLSLENITIFHVDIYAKKKEFTVSHIASLFPHVKRLKSFTLKQSVADENKANDRGQHGEGEKCSLETICGQLTLHCPLLTHLSIEPHTHSLPSCGEIILHSLVSFHRLTSLHLPFSSALWTEDNLQLLSSSISNVSVHRDLTSLDLGNAPWDQFNERILTSVQHLLSVLPLLTTLSLSFKNHHEDFDPKKGDMYLSMKKESLWNDIHWKEICCEIAKNIGKMRLLSSLKMRCDTKLVTDKDINMIKRIGDGNISLKKLNLSLYGQPESVSALLTPLFPLVDPTLSSIFCPLLAEFALHIMSRSPDKVSLGLLTPVSLSDSDSLLIISTIQMITERYGAQDKGIRSFIRYLTEIGQKELES